LFFKVSATPVSACRNTHVERASQFTSVLDIGGSGSISNRQKAAAVFYMRFQGLPSFGAIVPIGPFPFLDSRSVPQQEILDHKLTFTIRERTTAGAARYLAIECFRSGFDFDDLIQRIAVRAMERSLACNHDTPPSSTSFFID
jgi:hypothetical protein